MTAKINWIAGLEPNDEREEPIFHRVGYDGVTNIEVADRNFGDHGIGVFDVYKGDVLFSSVTLRAVAEIRYVDPSAEDTNDVR